MEYNDPHKEYHIIFHDNRLELKGSMESQDYKKADHFLKKIITKNHLNSWEIDISKLSFINSKAIRILAAFIMNSHKKIIIVIDDSISWQKIGIMPLKQLLPEDRIEIIGI